MNEAEAQARPTPTQQERIDAFKRFIHAEIPSKPRRLAQAMRPGRLDIVPKAPPEWDWRGRQILSAARDQGTNNTCTSFAIVAAIEANLSLHRRQNVRLAPGFIHSCLFRHELWMGIWGDDALAKATQHGVARGFSGDFPYPMERCATTDLVPIQGYSKLGTEAAAMEAIVRGPVVADMLIDPAPFVNLAAGSIYSYQNSPTKAAHNVVVIGYHASQRCWIIQNSMGGGWADQGFAQVAFGSGGILTDRYGWEVRV